MGSESDVGYRCPKCGATSALLMPQPILRPRLVSLKCLQCAHVLQAPRRILTGSAPAAPVESRTSRE